MKKKIKYSNEKLGIVKVIQDFLPKPKDLIFKLDSVKVPSNLNILKAYPYYKLH